MVHEFETASGRTLPNPARWFLTHECNGGAPEDGFYFLPTDDPNSEYENLHGVYGIDREQSLLTAIQWWPEFRQDMWPIGWDDFNGKFVLLLEGPMKGQIRYMPYHYFVDPQIHDHFLVAENVQAFSEMLKNPSLPEIED
jgi:hypothetical protein